MFCKNCGNQLADGAVFCGNCGTKVEVQPAPQPAYEAPQQPAYEAPQQPAYEAAQPSYTAPAVNDNDPALNSLATNTMVFGILGLALGIGFGLPGIIFSVIAKNKAKEFISRAGSLFGKAKVGMNLAKPGLIVSIIMTAIYFLYFIILMAGA